MDLTHDAAARQVDPAIVATWTVLARINGDATEFRVCTDGTTYFVVEHPAGPRAVTLAVSVHSDYITALHGVAACIEEEELPPPDRDTPVSLDITPQARIKQTWYCDKGPQVGLFGVALEHIYLTPSELEALHASYRPATSEENS